MLEFFCTKQHIVGLHLANNITHDLLGLRMGHPVCLIDRSSGQGLCKDSIQQPSLISI